MFASTPIPPHQKLGSYSTYSGVVVTIEKGAAIDQATRTATHLAAVLHMMTSSDLDNSVKEAIWMVTYMADEIVALLPLVVQDACSRKV